MTRPGCIVFLVDESSALDTKAIEADKTKAARTKATALATCLNAALKQLTDGPDVEVALVGYRTEAGDAPLVGSRFGGALVGQSFVSARQLAASPVRVESRTRRIPSTDPLSPPREETVQFPVWYEPTVSGSAVQVAAIEFVRHMLADWLARNPGAAPPLVAHVFAGGSADGNPQRAVTELLGLTGAEGPVQLFQCHLGSHENVPAVLYPASRGYVPVGPARDLFDRSSPLPPAAIASLKEAKLVVNPGARGLVYNGRPGDLIRFLALARAVSKSWAAPPAEAAPKPAPPPPAPPVEDVPAPAPIVVGQDAEGGPYSILGEPATPTDPARLLVLLLDRSAADPYGAGPQNAFTRLQERGNELLVRLGKEADPDLEVALICYGTDSTGAPEVRSGLDGPLAGKTIVRAAELADGALHVNEVTEEVSNGIGGLVSVTRRRPIYLELEPTAAALAEPAFRTAGELLADWAQSHSAPAHPPVLLHLTRGGHDPADADAAAACLGGRCLLYHLVVTESAHKSLAYPATADEIEGPALRRWWELSSSLHGTADRGFVVNGKFDRLNPAGVPASA